MLTRGLIVLVIALSCSGCKGAGKAVGKLFSSEAVTEVAKGVARLGGEVRDGLRNIYRRQNARSWGERGKCYVEGRKTTGAGPFTRCPDGSDRN